MGLLRFHRTISDFIVRRVQKSGEIDRLMKKYGTNRAYTEHYWNHITANHKDNALFDLYLESELGSLNRSRDYVSAFSLYFANKDLFLGKECLDIGCSSGNCLVAFVEAGARRAVGIEVSPGRYQTALINVGGCGDALRSRIKLMQADIQNIDPAAIGKFDIIFCNDVLEHVSDPIEAIRNICLLLKDSGEAFAFISLWNYQHPKNVLHEPHYDLPGLTLLPYELAKSFYLRCRNNSALDYEVYHWRSYDYYRARFAELGKDCIFFAATDPSLTGLDHLCKEAAELPALFEAACGRCNIPETLRLEAEPYLRSYITEIRERAEVCRMSDSTHVLNSFWYTYGMHFINMIITNRQG